MTAALALGSEVNQEDLASLRVEFENMPAEEVLGWAIQEFGSDVALATGFGAEGCVLMHMMSRIDRHARIFYLDTDLLFPETYELRDRLSVRYGINFERKAGRLSLSEQASELGERLWERNPDECCRLRKVAPLKETLSELRGWITAIRRAQSPSRSNAGVIEWDAKFGLVKINPLATWTAAQVWRYIFNHDVPYNLLHDVGYPSIGCLPCTTPIDAGEDTRAGRWRGSKKTECGLHS